MKKIIITIIIIIGIVGVYWYSAQAAIVIVDRYLPAQNSQDNFNTVSKGGQTFTASQNATITSASFQLEKIGSPPGTTMTAKLYTITGTYGSTAVPNTLLATSDTVNISTLTTSYATTTFTFSGANQVSLTSGTQYAIELNSQASNDGGNVVVMALRSSASHGGNYFDNLGGSYTTFSGFDALFEVLGSDGAGGSVSTVSDLVLFE